MIDLGALGGNKTIALFELKKVDEVPIGAISELLFYSHIIRDIHEGIFGYPGEEEGEIENQIIESERVIAFILASRLHPLIDNIKVFETLGETYSDRHQEFGFIKYEGTSESLLFTREY